MAAPNTYVVSFDIASQVDTVPILLYFTYNNEVLSFDSSKEKAYRYDSMDDAIEAVQKSGMTKRIGNTVKAIMIDRHSETLVKEWNK